MLLSGLSFAPLRSDSVEEISSASFMMLGGFFPLPGGSLLFKLDCFEIESFVIHVCLDEKRCLPSGSAFLGRL